ncbi:MAG TPA: hypothetical protein VKM55_27610 [Candidatus Lokiarchaeia archaeon]|nr:hypothetical protein [Candidatus Lokiarchaeia archaeon]
MPKMERDVTSSEEDGNLQQLTLELNSLKHSVNQIQKDVNELKNTLVNLSSTQDKVIELKEIPIEDA